MLQHKLYQNAVGYFILKIVKLAKRGNLGVNGVIMKNDQTIHDLANWFLDKESMSQKKLQKLCYYAVAWGYTLLDKPIVKNPQFQAWVHGPVSVDLWNSCAGYGWNSIAKHDKNWVNAAGKNLTSKSFPDDVGELLESVWVTYGKKSGNELEALSHKEAPWINARKGLEEFARSSDPLSVDDIKAYYKSIYIAN